MSSATSALAPQPAVTVDPVPPARKLETNQWTRDSSTDHRKSHPKSGTSCNRSESVTEQELLDQLYADYWSL